MKDTGEGGGPCPDRGGVCTLTILKRDSVMSGTPFIRGGAGRDQRFGEEFPREKRSKVRGMVNYHKKRDKGGRLLNQDLRSAEEGEPKCPEE